MDKAARKRLQQQLRDQERNASLRAFPLPLAELDEMFEVLENDLDLTGCDRSRRLTKDWLVTRGHAVDIVFAWLDEHGGFCDCEVVTNVRQHFDDARKATGTPPN